MRLRQIGNQSSRVFISNFDIRSYIIKGKKVSRINGSLFKTVNGISITCKYNVSVNKDKHDVFFLLRMLATDDRFFFHR